MSGFCGSCGAPLKEQSGFCGGCGARAGQQAVAAPVAKSSSSGGSALKIVLVVVGVLLVLGVMSIGGMYYMAHRYIRMAESLTGVKVSDVAQSVREAANRSSHDARAEKRDGCLLLDKDEASAILGIEIIKVSGTPDAQQSGEHCSFFVKPSSAEDNAERVKKATESIRDPSASNGEAVSPAIFDISKNMARAAVEAERNGEAPYFGYTVERENGRAACAGLGIANALSGVGQVTKAEEPLAVGDHSAMGIGESMMCVEKGGVAVTFDFTQVTSARNKGIALAKAILPRL